MECQNCGEPCHVEQRTCSNCQEEVQVSSEMELLLAVLELMSEKVNAYKAVMQNRLLMIKEDIVMNVTEEAMRYHEILNKSLVRVNEYMGQVQEMDQETHVVSDSRTESVMEMVGIEPFSFNLNSTQIQEGFNTALAGRTFVFFRELMRME